MAGQPTYPVPSQSPVQNLLGSRAFFRLSPTVAVPAISVGGVATVTVGLTEQLHVPVVYQAKQDPTPFYPPGSRRALVTLPVPKVLGAIQVNGAATVTVAASEQFHVPQTYQGVAQPVVVPPPSRTVLAPSPAGTGKLLSFTANGQATVTATLVKTAVVGPTVNGVATVTVTLNKVLALGPTVNGKATVTFSLNKVLTLGPTVNGKATVTIQEVKVAVLAPTANGTATVTATLVKTAVLGPSVLGVATVHATLTTSATVPSRMIAGVPIALLSEVMQF